MGICLRNMPPPRTAAGTPAFVALRLRHAHPFAGGGTYFRGRVPRAILPRRGNAENFSSAWRWQDGRWRDAHNLNITHLQRHSTLRITQHFRASRFGFTVSVPLSTTVLPHRFALPYRRMDLPAMTLTY